MACTEEGMSLLCVCIVTQRLFNNASFLGMESPWECTAISCRWPTQHQPPGPLPNLLGAWVLTLMLEHATHSQGTSAHTEVLASLNFTSIFSPHDGTFQQGSKHSLVVMDGDPAQSISCPIISSLLVLQSELAGGQHAHPPVPSGIKVWCGDDIHQ